MGCQVRQLINRLRNMHVHMYIYILYAGIPRRLFTDVFPVKTSIVQRISTNKASGLYMSCSVLDFKCVYIGTYVHFFTLRVAITCFIDTNYINRFLIIEMNRHRNIHRSGNRLFIHSSSIFTSSIIEGTKS